MSKIKIQDVREEVEKLNWELVSNKYLNLKTDLQVRCPEGHDCFVSFEKLRKGNYECPICKQNQYYNMSAATVTKKDEYRILAFDQASITSGWSIFDGEKLIKYGKWTSNGRDSTERISQTKYWVASMVENWNPDQIILEDIQLQKFGDQGEAVVTYKKLAHLQGVLINYFYEKRISVSIVPPATWRSFSQIKGRSRSDQKKNAQLKIKNLYDISVTQDEADAILIGRWGASEHEKRKIVTF